MGLLKAGIGAAGGVLADSWREYFYCDALDANTLVAKGQKRTSDKGRSSNTRGESNIISDGSIIAVNEGQFMIIVEQGAIVEACGEAGEFVFDKSTEPSLFFGEASLGDRLMASFERVGTRFTFGGDTGKDQRVYFFNTKEIMGNKYGTASPVPFRVVDNNIGLDVDISVRCNGEYSYKIVDPLMFYKNVCGNVEEPYTRDKIDSQLKSELLTALQPAFAKISAMGVRYSAVPGAHHRCGEGPQRGAFPGMDRFARHSGRVVRREFHCRVARRRGDDQRAAEGRGYARSQHGGREPGSIAGRRDAHGCEQRKRSHDGLHGHGHGERRGRHEPAGPLWHGRGQCASAEPVCNRAWRRVRPASSAGARRRDGRRRHPRSYSCSCPRACRRYVDVFVRRSEHRQVLRQLRLAEACAGRPLDMLMRHAEHRQLLRKLRVQATVARPTAATPHGSRPFLFDATRKNDKTKGSQPARLRAFFIRIGKSALLGARATIEGQTGR